MPTYTYQCHSCGKIFEKEQTVTEEPIKECPYCGGQVKRLITASSSFHLKGSGWYVTDYKKNKSDNQKKPQPKTSCSNTKKCDNVTCSAPKAANA